MVLAVAGLAVGALVGGLLTRQPQAVGPDRQAVTTQALGDRLAALEATVERTPDDIGAWQVLAEVAVRRAAQVGDPALYDLADRALGRAERLEPSAPRTVVAQGMLALARHEFDAALRHGRVALEQLPANTTALAVVVDAEVELGFYDDAAVNAQQMLDVRPGLPALSRTSYLRELRGDLAGAQTAMRQAEVAAASPADRATIAALQGDLAMLEADLGAAERHYTRALKVSPELVAASVGVARVAAARRDLRQAVTVLEELVDRRPQPAAVALLADVQQRLGREAQAQDSRDLVRALTDLAAQKGQVVDLELALFEADHGDTGRAVELARAAYRARPDNVYTADALAWALARDGQVDRARELVDDALRLGSIDPALRYRAATVIARADGPDAAREHVQFLAERAQALPIAYREDAAALADEVGVAVPSAWR